LRPPTRSTRRSWARCSRKRRNKSRGVGESKRVGESGRLHGRRASCHAARRAQL
jgi:hypothetical protein